MGYNDVQTALVDDWALRKIMNGYNKATSGCHYGSLHDAWVILYMIYVRPVWARNP